MLGQSLLKKIQSLRLYLQLQLIVVDPDSADPFMSEYSYFIIFVNSKIFRVIFSCSSFVQMTLIFLIGNMELLIGGVQPFSLE